MRFFSIFLIIFGIIIVLFPEILAYLIGGFFIFIGLNILLFFSKFKKSGNESYVKFGNYKIWR